MPDEEQGGFAEGGHQGPGAMKAEWYYAVKGRTYGPVTEEQLVIDARAGYFTRSDHVYADHLGKWVEAGRIEGLFAPARHPAYGSGIPAPPGASGVEGAPYYAPHYAGFWVRFAAVVIDVLVLAIPNVAIATAAGVYAAAAGIDMQSFQQNFDWHSMQDFRFPSNASQVAAIWGAIWIAEVIVAWLYYGLFESSRWQATIGKKAAGIVVTDMEGRRLSFARATARYAASWVSRMTIYVGYIIGAFTPKKQTLHDMIVNTVVVHGRRD